MYAPDTAGIATPVGLIRLTGDESTLWSIRIEEPGIVAPGRAFAVKTAADQLTQWFAGSRHAFDLPLARATTPRGEVLRQGMIAIPYGAVESYGAFARRATSSPRAIGQACARNPFPIVVPCHRVVASDGPGHYSAGKGVSTKQWLLAHEQRYRSAP